jgi:hypothetical protein
MTERDKAELNTWEETIFEQGVLPSVWAWGFKNNQEMRELPIYIKPLIW